MGEAPVDLIEDHYIETWRLMGGAVGGEVFETDAYVVARAALNHIPYNHVLRCSPTRDPDALIEEIFGRLLEREAVWTISSRCRPADLADRLLARGCEPYTTVTGMSLDLDEASVPSPPFVEGVELVEVTPDLLELWADLVLDQWHLSDTDRAILLAMHEEFGYERVRRFLCLADGVPVGKASFAVHQPDVIGIYGVGTSPQARRMGLASALTARALREAWHSGARTVVLHSTPMAVRLYENLGFRPHCILRVFSKPALTAPQPQPPVERLARM